MPALQMGLNRHLNAYHRSAPLLMQFLLAEFLQVYQQFHSIQTLIREEQFNHTLFSLLTRFSGPSPERVKFFHWSPDNGSLYKLYYYAAFTADQTEELEDFPHLEKTCRKCWMLGTHLLENIEAQKFDETDSHLQTLQRCIRQIAKEIVKAILMLKDNENLLYFLLRHQEQLDTIYGTAFTLKLLASLFPNGLSEAKSFLITKYSDRGFDKLADTIRQHFDKIV